MSRNVTAAASTDRRTPLTDHSVAEHSAAAGGRGTLRDGIARALGELEAIATAERKRAEQLAELGNCLRFAASALREVNDGLLALELLEQAEGLLRELRGQA